MIEIPQDFKEQCLTDFIQARLPDYNQFHQEFTEESLRALILRSEANPMSGFGICYEWRAYLDGRFTEKMKNDLEALCPGFRKLFYTKEETIADLKKEGVLNEEWVSEDANESSFSGFYNNILLSSYRMFDFYKWIRRLEKKIVDLHHKLKATEELSSQHVTQFRVQCELRRKDIEKLRENSQTIKTQNQKISEINTWFENPQVQRVIKTIENNRKETERWSKLTPAEREKEDEGREAMASSWKKKERDLH